MGKALRRDVLEEGAMDEVNWRGIYSPIGIGILEDDAGEEKSNGQGFPCGVNKSTTQVKGKGRGTNPSNYRMVINRPIRIRQPYFVRFAHP